MHKPYTLEMVHVRLQADREDHFRKVSLEQPSDGPVVVSSSSSMYSTILVAVGRHRTARSTEATSLHVCVEAHVPLPCTVCSVLAVRATSHMFTMRIVSLVLVLQATFHVSVMQIVFALSEPHMLELVHLSW